MNTVRLALVAAALSALPASLPAQLDYRNLDDDRPVSIEDAYPLERYAFEWLTSWRYVRHRGGSGVHSFVPELAYGILPNAHLGAKLPLTGLHGPGDWDWGLAGLRVFALYNLNTESPWLPAVSLRAEASFPAGSLAGEHTRFVLKGIATRSFGRGRLHLNGALGLGKDGRLGAAEAAPEWSAGMALDHSFIRSSTLLIVALQAVKVAEVHPTELNAALGLRRQLTPYTVLDLGVARRLRSEGPDFELTFGLSRAFAIAALMPDGR